MLFTGPACPVIAPTSVQTSSPVAAPPTCAHRQRRHPPDQPHASVSEPPVIQIPPTNPPRRCPPTSPKRCWLIHREAEALFWPDGTDTGDQRMREESVDVDSSVSPECSVLVGRQARDVTPASCPTRRASNVIENGCVLESVEYYFVLRNRRIRSPFASSLHIQHMLFQRNLPPAFFTIIGPTKGCFESIQ